MGDKMYRECVGDRDHRLWRQRRPWQFVGPFAASPGGTSGVAVRSRHWWHEDVILVAARTGRVAQPMASCQRTLLWRYTSSRGRRRKERRNVSRKGTSFGGDVEWSVVHV